MRYIIFSLILVGLLGMKLDLVRAQDRWHQRVFSSEFHVLSPDRLIGHLDHRSALFGRFPVGDSIAHQVFYTSRSLCNGELPGTPESVQRKGYFLLVDRGGCSFVEKVRNAQIENATAVFIADNKCLCSFEDKGECDSDLECQDDEPTMDDDGTGDDITIPSMLLMKSDGDKLKEELMVGTDVEVRLSWPIPKAIDGVTEYTLWMTPDDLLSHQFLMSFMDAAIALGNKAIFRPKMFVSDGTMKGCRMYNNDGSSDPCPGYCTNYGRYCEPRSYYDFESYASKGTKMVVESLRRACIWKVYGDSNGIGEHWWRYVQNWIVSCGSSHYSANCAQSMYLLAGVDADLVEQCMADSGNFREDTTNVLLEQSLDEASSFDVSFSPTLFVNGAVIRGSLTFGGALDAICSTYEPDDIPDICYEWKQCSDQCSSGTTCILRGDSCTQYEVPMFSNVDTIYDDDDYIENGYGDDPEPATPQDHDSSATDPPVQIPTYAPEASPVIPGNVNFPTDTTPPISSPTTPPSHEPTLPPVSPVFDTPAGKRPPGQELPNGPEKEVLHEEDGHQIVETIQIYESGRSSDIDGFAVGLGVGAGVAVCFGCILLFLVLRDRERTPYVQPIAMPMGGNRSMESMSYYPDQFRDEHDYSSGGEDDVECRSRKSSRRKFRKKHPASRRSFREHYDDEDEEEHRLVRSSSRSVNSRSSRRSSRSRSNTRKQTPTPREVYDVEENKSALLRRSMRSKKGDGELLSIGEEDEPIPAIAVEDEDSSDDEEEEVELRDYRRQRGRYRRPRS